MNRPLVSCIVITYNSAHFFETFFKTLELQADEGLRFEMIFIDNASSDGSFEEAERIMKGQTFFENIVWIKNTQNIGYSGAAEQGVHESKGEYVLIANPDIVFDKHYVALIVARMKSDPNIGAASGKLRKFDFTKYRSTKKLEDGKTMLLDSTGLVMYKNRRCVDRGQGMEDRGQYDTAEEVFGVTGACPIYRRSALDQITVNGHYYEPDFFMYKEDIDVCWRLRLAGFTCWYFPEALAYHGRGTGAIERESLASVMKNRSSLPNFTKHHSYRNERVMRLRNEFISSVVKNLPSIAWRELLMFGWMLAREPFLIKSLWEFIKRTPKTIKNRIAFKKNIKISEKQMRRWFV